MHQKLLILSEVTQEGCCWSGTVQQSVLASWRWLSTDCGDARDAWVRTVATPDMASYRPWPHQSLGVCFSVHLSVEFDVRTLQLGPSDRVSAWETIYIYPGVTKINPSETSSSQLGSYRAIRLLDFKNEGSTGKNKEFKTCMDNAKGFKHACPGVSSSLVFSFWIFEVW